MVGKVVSNTGLKVQSRVMLYKAVVQLVILYESESCVVMGAILKVIEGFCHRLYIRIIGMTAQRTTGG